ncbi:putative RNase H-like HicB family nuclease [Desulfitobacterium sp. LBE]|uniref:HicB-like antitoxin of toxin-antitoxin system domain-containing protein n=4 Tax=root TaxID=1 RepID=Q24QR2_DESHY|nr:MULTISPECIES: type II toxin-antitoxin system HicB family antitoxin [Desulfitobacterium]EHL06723.1 toxin-antitoxin system, antitoxin component, HicB family [Desulfitobacterium hafniense DP7]KTE89400.1 antitoxin HicB [Desulfitobacterium hafniense]MEA5023440.1 type II toxin-antitoxin system HicB family antitoxin [Desulfitobacterium hafniense]TWH57562.1 putative RNase H-like HicB family nuclease [Desulfitobacterium sp. LBE]CDX04025.1 Toxin-antitoxin system, antitoxin component, HicB [Desulfitob
MAKYLFPAVFKQEANGIYSINFPDIEGCYTQGDDVQDAYEMAEDVLCLRLYDLEESNEPIPTPSNPADIPFEHGSFITLIGVDTLEYRKFHDNKAIKKTLTIPQWLNSIAEREGINFSQVLQNALKEQLGIQ